MMAIALRKTCWTFARGVPTGKVALLMHINEPETHHGCTDARTDIAATAALVAVANKASYSSSA